MCMTKLIETHESSKTNNLQIWMPVPLSALAKHGVEELLGEVPGVGNVREAVPGHGAELHHAEEDGQPLLLPPERGEQREEEEEEHAGRRHPAGRRKHVL